MPAVLNHTPLGVALNKLHTQKLGAVGPCEEHIIYTAWVYILMAGVYPKDSTSRLSRIRISGFLWKTYHTNLVYILISVEYPKGSSRVAEIRISRFL